MRSTTADNQCCRRGCCRRHDGKLFGLGPLVPFCPAKPLSHSLSLLIHFLARVGDGFGRGWKVESHLNGRLLDAALSQASTIIRPSIDAVPSELELWSFFFFRLMFRSGEMWSWNVGHITQILLKYSAWLVELGDRCFAFVVAVDEDDTITSDSKQAFQSSDVMCERCALFFWNVTQRRLVLEPD